MLIYECDGECYMRSVCITGKNTKAEPKFFSPEHLNNTLITEVMMTVVVGDTTDGEGKTCDVMFIRLKIFAQMIAT